MSGKPRVGEILVQAGVIDQMQLASALGEQSRWGRRLGVTLIKMGMVEEGHLVRALATQLDLPVASLSGKRITDDVIALVPMEVATEHGVIPLVVQLTRAIELDQPSALEAEVSQPIGTFALPINRVGQSLLVPQAICQYFAFQIFDHLWNRSRNPIGISGISIRIEDKQTFVNVLCQSFTPITAKQLLRKDCE